MVLCSHCCGPQAFFLLLNNFKSQESFAEDSLKLVYIDSYVAHVLHL